MKTPHPFGDKARHPFITTDFSEAQVEIGTEVCSNPDQVYDQLENLHDIVSTTVAVENELCETGSIDPADNGGTGTEDFMKLYEKVNEKIGDRLNVECFDYDKALSVDEMADKLDEGSVLNIAVDSATLWDQNDHIPGELAEDVCTDHWITVTGVDRDANGEVIGFNIIDSGGGESYADIEKYERMCFGETGREVIYPTSFVVSKNDPVDTGKSG